MKLSTLLLLMEGKAWFPSVAALRAGDPFEGALGEDFHQELWRALERAGHGREDTQKWLFDSLPAVNQNSLNMNHGYPGLSSQQLGWAYSEALAKRRAVWCWFRSRRESAAMWSIYGHQGVAVMTDRKRLNDALKGAVPSVKHFRLQKMTYVDRSSGNHRYIGRILSKRRDLVLRPYFLKAIEYQHEKELRVATFCATGNGGVMVPNIDPALLIREIAISPLLPAGEAAAIKQVVYRRIDGVVFTVGQSVLTGEEKQIGLANAITQDIGISMAHDERSQLPAALRSL